jgi:hypothetical protein
LLNLVTNPQAVCYQDSIPYTMWLAIYLYTIAIPLLIAGAKPLHDIHAISGGDDDFIVPHYPYFPLRILPLGASITWGQASTDGNGYRNHLRELLEQRCTLVDMVGNVQSGGMPDNVRSFTFYSYGRFREES